MGSGKDSGKGADWRTYARYAALTDEELARQCEVQVFRAKGPGGQGVNTTDSAVRMVHVPTGIAVTSRESRSQHQNRRTCLEKLKRIFERRAKPPKHRIKTKVPRAVRERRLSDKRHRSERKRLRRNVSWE